MASAIDETQMQSNIPMKIEEPVQQPIIHEVSNEVKADPSSE